MSKTRKLQDFAEDLNPSQSDDMEVLPQGDGTPSEMLKAAKQMTAAADTITRHAETMGLAVDGIGRYLLNEDGTVRDFTNKKLMESTSKNVNQGVQQMNNNAASISEKVEKMPTHIDATFTEPAFEAIGQLNDNLRKERYIFFGAIILIAFFAAFVAYKGLQIADKSEKLTQWYEDNNEAILFGRYLRVNENDRWRFWHDKWVNDPGLKEDMNDYFQMEEWKEKKRKK